MKQLYEIRQRHLEERMELIRSRETERVLLKMKHQAELSVLSAHAYGSNERVQLLLKHSLELKELKTASLELFTEMKLKHKQELSI